MTVLPYFSDGIVTLYLGDMREVLPALNVTADCIVTDPPYASTKLQWDIWPAGWIKAAATATKSMWCFMPLRMFAAPPFRGHEFDDAGWRLSHEIIWEKHNGPGFATDRFRCVHETVSHWYQGAWPDIYHDTPRGTAPENGRSIRRPATQPSLHGARSAYVYVRGPRLMRSVIRERSMHRRTIHPTEKPVPLLAHMIHYACPPGGLVIDPFAGSGSTLEAARSSGRRAIGVEANEEYAERAARRLSQAIIPGT